LHLIYVITNAALILGFLSWFFLRLESIIDRNGSLDIYLNIVFRLFPWQLALYFVYAATHHLIWFAS